MTRIAVIYKSKYGTTKQYAEWIASELGASLYEASSIKPVRLTEYDVVVYGGGLYAGGIIGVNLVTKNPCKSLIVFTVGAANPNNTDYSDIISKNISQELLSKIKIFHLRGGLDYTKMNLIHKIMMSVLKKSIEKKPLAERHEEDPVFLETYGKTIDFTDKSTIAPLVEYVRAL